VLNIKHLIINKNNIKENEFYIILTARHYITFSEKLVLAGMIGRLDAIEVCSTQL